MVIATVLLLSAMSSNFQLRVRIYNEADVPARVQDDASKTAERIFRLAGIDTKWLDCGYLPRRPVRDSLCWEPHNSLDIQIHIIPQPMSARLSPKTTECGRSMLSEDGFGGDYAYVYARCVDDLGSGLNQGTMLGHMLAHEIGHLLLGVASHELRGIMSSRWTVDEDLLAAKGALLFHPWQAQQMRERMKVLKAAQPKAARPVE